MASEISRNYNISATYGSGIAPAPKIMYEDVRQGIARGQNSIRLWRQFKGVMPEEMAGVLDIPQKTYNAIEQGIKPSFNQLWGICWYLDIHPTDLHVQNSIDMPDHYLAAIINAHNNPSCWPQDSEESREFTHDVLESVSLPGLSYDILKEKAEACEEKLGFTRVALLPILETALVNDGNPVFYQQGGLNRYVLKAIVELEKTTTAQKKAFQTHEASYSDKIATLKRKGTAIYREKNWPRVQAMLDDFFVPQEKNDAVAFLMHEIKRPRRVPPPQQSDFEELMDAYEAVRRANRFESDKSLHSNTISRNETFREIVSDFYHSNKCFILAYDNRQAVLVKTKGIAEPKGDQSHFEYKRHGMRDRLSFSKRFTPS
tara:strand:+ start:790 stop:1908 length:1119 start_codon:yes stop_codon:yes gene_type:complete